MSRGQHLFKEADITRAIRAAQKAGREVKIEISLDRREMCITTLSPDKPVAGETDLDRELAEFEKRHGMQIPS